MASAEQQTNSGKQRFEQAGEALNKKPDAAALTREAHHGTASEQQAMWNKVLETHGNGDTAKKHLPAGFSISGSEAHHDRKVQDAKHNTIYDEQKTAERANKDSQIHRGESAYQSLRRQGMSSAEANKASEEIKKEEHFGQKGHRQFHAGDSVEQGKDGKYHLVHKGAHPEKGKDEKGDHGKDAKGDHGKDEKGDHGKDAKGEHGKDAKGDHTPTAKERQAEAVKEAYDREVKRVQNDPTQDQFHREGAKSGGFLDRGQLKSILKDSEHHTPEERKDVQTLLKGLNHGAGANNWYMDQAHIAQFITDSSKK